MNQVKNIMKLSDIAKNKAPIEMLYHWEKESPDKVYLRQPINDEWQEHSWQQVGQQVRKLTTALQNLGFEKGDKIAIISKNCAQWLMTDLALQLGGFVSVPLYFDQTPDSFKYILEHSDAKALFIGKLESNVWDRLKDSVPEGMSKIGFSFHGSDGDFDREGQMDHYWMDLVNNSKPFTDNPIPADEDPWTIVYTSGTTGHPKGAVHCYRAPRFVGSRSVEMFKTSPADRGLSFLPLAHVAERLLVATNSLYAGIEISFVQSQDTFQRDLCSVQPTIFFSVPRLWKKFQGGVLEKVPQKKLDVLLKIPVIKSIVARKMRKALGLDKARMVVSGAAPLSVALLKWYEKIGIEILEGYGMTENFAYGFIGRIGETKHGTVGTPMPGCGYKLSDAGEVLFKSPTLMLHYYKDEEKTKEAVDSEGYYHTGDIGEEDEQGFLKVAGRIKETFKTEKGEFVAPAPIEEKLASFKDFEQICLGGLGLKQPVVVATLSDQAQNKPRHHLENKISEHVKLININLLNHEKIAGVIVSNEDWQPDTGLVTPTLKVKRNMIEKRYAKLMEQAVESDIKVLWEASN